MKEDKLKEIWQQGENDRPKYTLAEIAAYREQKSKDTTRNLRLEVLFSTGYKSVVALGILILLFLIPGQLNIQLIMAILLLCTLGLIALDFRYLKKVNQINETGTIMETLQQKLRLLQTEYRQFLFWGALTNPLFILTGFFYYFLFKYGEITMESPWEDPVLYGFLLIGYLIALLAALPGYRMRIAEVRECMEDMDEQYMASRKIVEQKKQKRRFFIVAAILVLGGILFLLILLLR
jgi:Ca2+/Na+ antiporter